MVKIRGLAPDADGLREDASMSVYWDNRHSAFIVRGRRVGMGADTPKRKAARAEFSAACAMAKKCTSADQIAAMKLAVGSPYTWKDILISQIYGKYWMVQFANGKEYWSNRAMSETAQVMLNSISNVPGSILVRLDDVWVGLDPGNANDVVTLDPHTGFPVWLPTQGGGGGGGYDPGTPPLVVQVAHSSVSGNSATFPVPPTAGNLLVAFVSNPTAPNPAAGWAVTAENDNGTDYDTISIKIAGASESATQTPLLFSSTDVGIVIYELAIPSGTPNFLFGNAGVRSVALPANTPVFYPNAKNCIGLSVVFLIPPETFASLTNVGNLDVNDATGTRYIAAASNNLSLTPMAGMMTVLSANGETKSLTCLISA